MNNAGGNEEPEIVLSGALVRRRITEHLFIMLPVLFPECNPCGEGKSPDIPGHRGFPDGVHPAGGQDGGGEIRRFLRDDGAVKVSRSLKERAQTVRMARKALEQRLGREPVLSELSRETGFTPEEIAEAETATAAAASLQQVNGEDGPTLEELLSDPEQEERMIESLALREAIRDLPQQERMVIAFRYYRGMTQTQTAELMGVSQVQVSRLERRAVEALRKSLQ